MSKEKIIKEGKVSKIITCLSYYTQNYMLYDRFIDD